MSYILDGKVSGQFCRIYKGGVQCSCCSFLIKFPSCRGFNVGIYYQPNFHYIGTPYYIYESKSGYSSVYCSDKCRRKHNHRFNNQPANSQLIKQTEVHVKRFLEINKLRAENEALRRYIQDKK